MKSFKRGFTLIELLIVIALLGALAVGLLATINPVEQIRKGRDTSTRSIAVEFFDANQRYFANNPTAYAWGTGAVASMSLTGTSMTTAIAALIAAGELKSNFSTVVANATLTSIFVTSTGLGDNNVCFQPTSNGVKADPNAIFNISGATTTSCGASTSTCYYCMH